MINLLPLPVLGTLSFVMILKFCGINTKMAITMKYFAAALSVLFTSSFFIGWLSPQSAEEFHWKLVSDWAPLFYIAVLAVLDYLLYKTTLRVISWGNSRINSNKDCIK